ncbi:hypothetical protein X777_02555 [Ooceraea biroi]|uniref:Uncharacterized protein n=1 Tax=Ooceraea biroi TaxID=2015173 RepID=A0A026WQB4_OOCBI|nr:hypothetical protein X777_02555 [Ooceraea biroi]
MQMPMLLLRLWPMLWLKPVE